MATSVSEMSVREMREELQSLGINVSDCIEKRDFVEKLTAAREVSIKRTSDTAGNILIAHSKAYHPVIQLYGVTTEHL